MNVIQANCRVEFASEDIDFILSVLGGKIGSAECLIKLLSDEESRDLVLDDDALFHALLVRGGCCEFPASSISISSCDKSFVDLKSRIGR
jgi:hypothetical protein